MTESKYPKVKIAGLEVEIRSEEECAQADVFIALPTAMVRKSEAGGARFPEGSQGGYPCRVCGIDCTLAPSGQRMIAMGAEPTCMDCVLKMSNAEKEGQS
jgi:hypothetical protein